MQRSRIGYRIDVSTGISRTRLILKAVVAALLTWALALPFLLALPLPVAITLATLVWIAATIAPWSRWWRGEWIRARQLRHANRTRRVLAAAIPLIGLATCVASDYWFGTHGPSDLGRQVIGVRWDVAISAPFWLVAILLLTTGISRTAAVVAAVVLGLLSSFSYEAVTTSHSSTAAIGYLYPWLVGFPAVIVIYVLDGVMRGLSSRIQLRRT
jgi:hypothetical protein